MANTVHGPFVKGGSTTGIYTGGGSYTSGNANNGETQSAVALASFNPDLITAAFILSGVACVKDATTASQLNITSGEAYVVMSDGTIARIDVAATSQSASGHPSTTMYLYLQPDGTWYWSTSNSPAANSLAIAQVTTDGSSNISGVTDKRVTLAQLLTGAAHPSAGQPGGVLLPSPVQLLATTATAYMAQVNGGVTFGQVGALRGSMDGAALFNGTTGYLTFPATGMPTGNSSVTLECWVKMSGIPGTTGIPVGYGGGAGQSNLYLQVNSGTGTAQVAGLSSNSAVSSALSLNAWHHLVGIYDASVNKISCYVDGASTGAAVSVTSTNFIASFGTISLAPFATSNFFSGQIDEVAVYATALSSARVTAHYNAALSTTSDGYAAAVLADAPLRYYRLGDAVGAKMAADTISPTSQQIVNADGTLQIGGIGGQAAAAGSLGAPVIVAQGINVHVTATTTQTICTFTPPTDGLYRASGHFELSNGTSGQTVTFGAVFTDPHRTGSYIDYFLSENLSGIALVNGGTSFTNSTYGVAPITFYAQGGQPVSVTFQDPGGTPNDYVSAIIERLS